MKSIESDKPTAGTESARNPGDPRWVRPVIALGLLVFGIYSATHMVAAGDTWVALACGRHFAEHGVDTVEPFSFNSHPAGPTEEDIAKWPGWARTLSKPFSLKTIQQWHPTGWINQNWLTHWIFYKLARGFGSEDDYNYNMLVYWKFALFILTAFVVYGVGRVIGVGRALALAAACFSLVVGRSFFDIRPACNSNLLVPVFLLVLALATYRNLRWIWLLVPLVVFWANVHGGYIYVFLLLAPFLVLHGAAALPKKWTFAVGLIGLWWVLYLLSHQFLSNRYTPMIAAAARRTYEAPALLTSGYAVFLLVLTGLGIGALFLPERMKAAFTLFYGISTLVVFFVLFIRIQMPVEYARFTEYYRELFRYFVQTSQVKFLFVFLIGLVFTFLMTWKKDRLVILPPRHIREIVLAGGVSFLAMILLNPFHLTNLTHTFEISVSEHAASWRQVNEWRPAFDWMDKTRNTPNPVGDEEAFAVLCILAGIALVVWLAGRLILPRFLVGPSSKSAKQPPARLVPESWPKMDLALWTLAGLTIYMAIQSRRFIAIAGPAACPFAALLVQQSWGMVSIVFGQKKNADGRPQPFPKDWVFPCWSGLAAVVLVCAAVWGWKYKKVYLDPWPNDPVRQSVFMRMTASNVKPFEVCDFINGNGLRGRMFNYWTEGGALAFGQTPDPETGQIPLKLFMDGRAQAAYNHDKYEYWQLIFSGGPETARDKLQGKSVDYKKTGRWLSEELKKNKVWVIVMPNNQVASVFMRAISQTENWKTVFLDTSQQLLVDLETPEGRRLADSILEGRAFFPDALSQHLSTAMLILETRSIQHVSSLMEHATAAFSIRPCASSFMVVQNAANWPPFKEKATEIIGHYLDHFRSQQETLKKEAGYVELLTVASHAAEYLARTEPKRGTELRQLQKEFRTEAERINLQGVW